MNQNATQGADDRVTRVFVSYAREDRKWLDRDYRYNLVPFLVESLKRQGVVFWFDKELVPGDEFRTHIERQIDQSQIALLIVSQAFLNSEFIELHEMPLIAERASRGQMIVVPVLVEPCDWSEYPVLADRQMVPGAIPLIEFTESEAKWARVKAEILDGLKVQVKRIRGTAPDAGTASRTRPQAETATQFQLKTGQPEGRGVERVQQDEAARPVREVQEKRIKEAAVRRSESVALVAKERSHQTAEGQQDPNDGFTARSPAMLFVAAVLVLTIIAGAAWFASYHNGKRPERAGSDAKAATASVPATGKTADSKVSPRPGWIVGAQGTILNSMDGGRTWHSVASGVPWNLTSLSSAADGSVWAAGEAGTILHTDRAGQVWKKASATKTPGTFNGLSMMTPEKGWAVGQEGVMARTEDGGVSWHLHFSGVDSGLSAVSFFSPDLGWSVGSSIDVAFQPQKGVILHTEDGGNTWKRQWASPQVVPTHVWFLTPDNGWVTGLSGSLLHTEDGGRTWKTQSTGTHANLNCVRFVTKDSGWIVGSAGVTLHTEDGGRTWTQQSSGSQAYLESVAFVSPRDGWAVGSKGTILHTEDGGTHWTKQEADSKRDLYAIVFAQP